MSAGHGEGPTLDERVRRWEWFVSEVEEGFDTTWVWEYDQDIRCRDWLHDAWPILTERIRAHYQGELDALDDRFLAATAPIRPHGAGAVANPERWWRHRYPQRVSGTRREDHLPPTWSPTPAYVEL
ncbi:hypothetical protein BLA24_21165 [Streptomyces cinnamoneus]|uniref:Uncharacterized protein n=1 Tax=Streptomyces cinnamoneus TaxID=53446 RepID=A0A2G1XFU1_STRCJ|nr:hypothetical protein BLA24_21165 [Streptomyces cinnamoneus]PPT13116.1 hypothetical protein CYQ11_09620 [Streptomyces cinnamoneus]